MVTKEKLKRVIELGDNHESGYTHSYRGIGFTPDQYGSIEYNICIIDMDSKAKEQDSMALTVLMKDRSIIKKAKNYLDWKDKNRGMTEGSRVWRMILERYSYDEIIAEWKKPYGFANVKTSFTFSQILDTEPFTVAENFDPTTKLKARRKSKIRVIPASECPVIF